MNLTVYDPNLKLVALSSYIKGVVGVIGEWGGLYAITPEPALVHISEKDLQSKMEILFKKNQFDIAIWSVKYILIVFSSVVLYVNILLL